MVKKRSSAYAELPEKTRNDLGMQTFGVDPEIQDDLGAYYNEKLDNFEDVIHHDDLVKIAFYKTIEYGFLALFFYDVESSHFFFNEGYFHGRVRELIKNHLHRLNEKNNNEIYTVYVDERLYNLELRYSLAHSRRYIFGAITQESRTHSGVLSDLQGLFSRYYLVGSLRCPDVFEYDSLPALNRILRDTAERAQRNSRRLHYILLDIEPLSRYIKIAGDYLVSEVLKDTRDTLCAMIEGEGTCYALNSRQFLIVATNLDEKIIKEKFAHAHLHIKNLLLIYQMNYYEVTDFENGYQVEKAWPHLISSKALKGN